MCRLLRSRAVSSTTCMGSSLGHRAAPAEVLTGSADVVALSPPRLGSDPNFWGALSSTNNEVLKRNPAGLRPATTTAQPVGAGAAAACLASAVPATSTPATTTSSKSLSAHLTARWRQRTPKVGVRAQARGADDDNDGGARQRPRWFACFVRNVDDVDEGVTVDDAAPNVGVVVDEPQRRRAAWALAPRTSSSSAPLA